MSTNDLAPSRTVPVVREIAVLLLLLALSVGLLVEFHKPAVIDPSQNKHWAAALDFYQRHDFFGIHVEDQPYLAKPPLPFWIVAAPMWILGATPAALSLTSEVFALVLVFGTYVLGRRFFGQSAGFFAALVMLVNLILPWITSASVIDTTAAVLVSLPLVFFYLGWRHQGRRTLFVFLYQFSSALAMCHRGPLGAILPLLTVAAVLVPLGQWRVLAQFHNPLAVGMWLAIVVPYYVVLGAAFGHSFFMGENIHHFLAGEPRVVRPPYFFAAATFFRYFPWSPFSLLALVYAYRRRSGPERMELWFLVAWLASWFTFWNLAAARNESYTLLVGPPIALLTGTMLAQLWRDPAAVVDTPAKRVWLFLCFFSMAMSAPALPMVTILSKHLAFSRVVTVILTVALVAWALVVIALAAARRYRTALVVGVVLVTTVGFPVTLWVRPLLYEARVERRHRKAAAAKTEPARPVVPGESAGGRAAAP